MQDLVTLNYNNKVDQDVLVGAYIADIHFGVMDPETQYNILKEQFIDKIAQSNINFDLISIAGDLFDHKALGNSDLIMYALKFIDELINYCIRPYPDRTLIIVAGTYNHDAKQYKLLYRYLADTGIDVRIVEQISFQYVKGHRILCIPELAGVDENIYREYLFNSGWYNQVIMHGTIKGAVAKDTVGNCRLFTIDDFVNCTGPIISGHVHAPGCFNTYFYYTGSPYSWCFDDKDDKGFLIVISDKKSRMHYTHKERIESFRYETINLDDLISADAKDIIKYITELKDKKGIDYLRIEFTLDVPKEKKTLLDSYYKNKEDIKFKYSFTKEKKMIEQRLSESDDLKQYDYIFDPSMNEYQILARYINDDKGYIFVTADQIKKFVEDEF